MDNISTAGWLLIILALTLMMFLLTAVFTLVTGGLCGYFMSKLTVRRGLWYGLLVSLPATAIRYAIESYPALLQPRYNLFEVILIAGTVGLCWWKNKRLKDTLAREAWQNQIEQAKAEWRSRDKNQAIRADDDRPLYSTIFAKPSEFCQQAELLEHSPIFVQSRGKGQIAFRFRWSVQRRRCGGFPPSRE